MLAFAFSGAIYRFGGGLLGLRPVALAADAFNEDRVGVGHLGFAVPAVADLRGTVGVLDGLGVAHGDVKDTGSGSIWGSATLMGWRSSSSPPPDRGSPARPAGGWEPVKPGAGPADATA